MDFSRLRTAFLKAAEAAERWLALKVSRSSSNCRTHSSVASCRAYRRVTSVAATCVPADC
jgi:hypothetical protein